MGRRVQIRELDPDTTKTLQVTSDKKYLWDGVEIAEERDTTGGIVLRRFYNQGFVDSDGTALFYTRDHLGSIRELTDGTQAIRARYDYDPWGRPTQLQGDRQAPFQYAGYFWHAASDLDLARYRAYDPNLGRWISRDPIQERAGLNLYGFVRNNPIGAVDRLGLCDVGTSGTGFGPGSGTGPDGSNGNGGQSDIPSPTYFSSQTGLSGLTELPTDPDTSSETNQDVNPGNSMLDRFLDGYQHASDGSQAMAVGNAIGNIPNVDNVLGLIENGVGAAQATGVGFTSAATIMGTAAAWATFTEFALTGYALSGAQQVGKVIAGLTNLYYDAY
jgi:RHS repeat-associated protein